MAPAVFPLARFRLDPINQDVGDRRQQHVLHLLLPRPALTAQPIPVGDLIDVLFMAVG